MGVILALFCTVVEYRPAWADDDEEETGGDFKDPTIVTDDSSSVPQGVKDLGKKEKKPIVNPVYGEWYFWAATAAVAVGWTILAVWPGRQKAAKCVGGDNGPYSLGCIGDGR